MMQNFERLLSAKVFSLRVIYISLALKSHKSQLTNNVPYCSGGINFPLAFNSAFCNITHKTMHEKNVLLFGIN